MTTAESTALLCVAALLLGTGCGDDDDGVTPDAGGHSDASARRDAPASADARPIDAGAVGAPVALVATTFAFAARRSDGSVLCWGRPNNGGACADQTGIINTHVENLAAPGSLPDGTVISATVSAFAALLPDGSVRCWGFNLSGGACAGQSITGAIAADLAAPGSLPAGSRLIATSHAFAALRPDGSAVCWGDSNRGGACAGESAGGNAIVADLSAPASLAEGTLLYSVADAVAAVAPDGSVRCWGDRRFGGACAGQSTVGSITPDLSAAASLPGGTRAIGTAWGNLGGGAFAALLPDGSLRCWGRTGNGGACAGQSVPLTVIGTDLTQPAAASVDAALTSTESAFAVTLADGSVRCWGGANYGGACAGETPDGVTAIPADLSQPGALPAGARLLSTSHGDAVGGAFAAVRPDGSAVCWGHTSGGACAGQDLGVPTVIDLTRPGSVDPAGEAAATVGAFAVLAPDGSARCWGHREYGAACAGEAPSGTTIVVDLSAPASLRGASIYASGRAFAAVKPDGSATCWGAPTNGGACAGQDVGSAAIGIDLSAPGALY